MPKPGGQCAEVGKRAERLRWSFASAKPVAGRVLPLLGPLLVSGLDTASKVAKVRVPLLVIHRDRDDVIDHELGRRVFEAHGSLRLPGQCLGRGITTLWKRRGRNTVGACECFMPGLAEKGEGVEWPYTP